MSPGCGWVEAEAWCYVAGSYIAEVSVRVGAGTTQFQPYMPAGSQSVQRRRALLQEEPESPEKQLLAKLTAALEGFGCREDCPSLEQDMADAGGNTTASGLGPRVNGILVIDTQTTPTTPPVTAETAAAAFLQVGTCFSPWSTCS